MPTERDLKTVNAQQIDRLESRAWGGLFVMGLLVSVLGAFAIMAAGITALVSAYVFGLLLLAAGIVEVVAGIRQRKERPFVLYLLGGIFSVVVGVLLLASPMVGIAALGLLMIGYFLASGLFYGITSVVDRHPRWGWDLAYGIAAVFLAVVAISNWPVSSLPLVGILVGALILMRGVTLMAMSLAVRDTLKRGVPRRTTV